MPTWNIPPDWDGIEEPEGDSHATLPLGQIDDEPPFSKHTHDYMLITLTKTFRNAAGITLLFGVITKSPNLVIAALATTAVMVMWLAYLSRRGRSWVRGNGKRTKQTDQHDPTEPGMKKRQWKSRIPKRNV